MQRDKYQELGELQFISLEHADAILDDGANSTCRDTEHMCFRSVYHDRENQNTVF